MKCLKEWGEEKGLEGTVSVSITLTYNLFNLGNINCLIREGISVWYLLFTEWTII